MSLDSQIEAVLFYKTEPYRKDALAAFFEVSLEEADAGLQILAERLKIGGTRLIMTDTTVQLTTAPEYSALIEQLKKDELSSDIGKAGAETLAIITYRGPLSRAEIDKIRGVNSTFIIRNLLVRGLIERRDHPSDSRSFMYAVTPMLLSHLGVTTREELPDFESVMNAVDSFEKNEELSIAESIT
jgi:segregation and condensation protein B